MPLPKKLKKGASKKKQKKVISATMHDLKHGPHHKDRTRKQEVAIAMRQAGKSRKKKAIEDEQPNSKSARNHNAKKRRPKSGVGSQPYGH